MINLTDYNYIQDLLLRNNFRFSKSMGQNFLIESWVPEKIADEANITKDTTVVEVGPGIGCLTRELSERAGKVISYEIDKTLLPILSETLTGCDNVEIVFRDFMKEDDVSGDKFVANIPYNITSPLISKVIKLPFDEIVVMIQKEVAKRICASVGDADYSSFGILCQWYTEPEILFDVSSDCFMPRPKVTSSVIRMKRREKPPVKVIDEKQMFSIIRSSFNFRRKTLVNAMNSGMGIEKEKTAEVLNQLGIDEKVRGEALSIVEFAQISDKLSLK